MAHIEKYTETDLVRGCLQLLELRGFAAWRNNTGAVVYTDARGKKRFVKYGLTGSSDIFAIAAGGRFMAIECKLPGKEPTPEQEDFLTMVRSRDAIAIVVTSVDELVLFLDGRASADAS